jgi:cytidylate kinase
MTVVAIDGPSASGKGSTSRELAARLGFLHVDTGAMYRALTWHCQQAGVIPADASGRELNAAEQGAVARECVAWPVRVVSERGQLLVEVGGRRLGEELRGAEVTAFVARVSHVQAVRDWMLGFQRGCVRFGDLVMDGRDIGTRIFTETPLKYFLEACPEVRRKRGGNEGHGGGVAHRDELDKDLNRPAADALQIDTSEMPVAAVVEKVLNDIRAKQAAADARRA